MGLAVSLLYGVHPEYPGVYAVAGHYNLSQIRAALAETSAEHSFYLDLQTGEVVAVHDTDPSPEAEELRNQIMEGYGDRYRYIPGGNAAADDAAVSVWFEAEGLA